jgi:hypothetical protein
LGLVITEVLLLTAAGRNVPVYAVLGAIASVPLLCDNRRLRIAGEIALLLTMVLILNDFYSGQKLDNAVRHVRETASTVVFP